MKIFWLIAIICMPVFGHMIFLFSVILSISGKSPGHLQAFPGLKAWSLHSNNLSYIWLFILVPDPPGGNAASLSYSYYKKFKPGSAVTKNLFKYPAVHGPGLEWPATRGRGSSLRLTNYFFVALKPGHGFDCSISKQHICKPSITKLRLIVHRVTARLTLLLW
jgi:hypothetical protein